ncbi:hypothetical protein CLIB1423_16S01970 [[Candida] railenensis]|uniref:Zn(2)-C6 fungal-type domain-containing protein n=1 Tax=[Candida] railenensis TaxID=45579 RepID=A0A9P0VZ22_9ASCO|nr:hypothetical protein CLIB1423_16S01970 [[Candida] railenensis]
MNVIPMKAVRKRRHPNLRKTKCMSCRKLKIKCDEATPKCEYCSHTDKECIYPTEKQLDVILSASVNAPSLTSNSRRLNASTSHMNISKFELRLLYYFNQVCLTDQAVENPGMERVWKIEVPMLWQQSDLVRHSVFSLSALILSSLCNLEAVYKEDYSFGDSNNFDNWTTGFYKGSKTKVSDTNSTSIEDRWSSKVPLFPSKDKNSKQLVNDKHDVDNEDVDKFKELLFEKSNEYFVKSLRRTYAVMENVQRQDMVVKSQHQAAEIVMSGILLFSFLTVQPYGLVPIISDDPKITDLVSMVKGIKVSMTKSFPLLYYSSFGEILKSSERVSLPILTEDDVYPICENLERNMQEYFEINPEITDEEKKHLEGALYLLKVVIYRAIESSKQCSILRYLFVVEDWILEEAKQSRNLLCLKILFIYACLCLMGKVRISLERSIFSDYLHWYKNFNIEHFGAWRYPDDEAFYDLIIEKGLVVDGVNFAVLKTFDPLTYNIENHNTLESY